MLGIIDRTGIQTMLYLTCTMIHVSSLALLITEYRMLNIEYLWIVVQFKLTILVLGY